MKNDSYLPAEKARTAPVIHQLRRLVRAAQLTPLAIRHARGVKNTLKKALQIFRREGLAGVRQRLRLLATTNVERNDYALWVARYDTLDSAARQRLEALAEGLPRQPVISVLMPVYNPDPAWLDAAIISVRQQIYDHWELCIADDASTLPAVRAVLERHAREEARIKIVFRVQNGHISAASNSALSLVSGEWVALLDHDDLLSEHALLWVAEAINRHPEGELFYSDEDKVDENGRRFGPYFKCNWNPDLFYSHNLITHLGVYRSARVRAMGGFQLGLEGAQDYDLALRYIEQISPSQIHHIARVLYHWRAHEASTSQSATAKPYAMLAGERALNAHLQRCNIAASATLTGHGYRLRYTLRAPLPLVSLIIPTRNGLHLIRTCVESVLNKTDYANYEILIIDNGSDDPATLVYFDHLRSDARIRIIRDEGPFNYSALNNAAVRMAKGEVLGLLNNDLEVISPEWLTEMVSLAMQPAIGAVGARLWYPDGTLQHGGVILGIGGVAGHAHKGFAKGHPGYVGRASLISGFSAVTAACLVVRKDVFTSVGGLDEVDLKVACNDVDFCLRVRAAGYRNVWTPYAELYHHESATRGYEDTPEKVARLAAEAAVMRARWGALLENDPAYSPNLTLDYEDFSLAWPPRISQTR